MNTQELPLFIQKSHTTVIDTQSHETISPQLKPAYNLNNELDSVHSLLNTLFPENRAEDKELLKVKEILGEKGKELTEQQIKDLMVKVKYLVEVWLDQYERQVFNGMTLNELLSYKQL